MLLRHRPRSITLSKRMLLDENAGAGRADLSSRPTLSSSLYGQLLAFVRRRSPSSADAEDLVQQIMLKVLLSDHPKDELFSPWLFRVAKNAAIDATRAAQSKKRREELTRTSLLDSPEESPAHQSIARNERRREAGEEFDSEAISEYLVELLDELDEGDRALLADIDLRGQSQRSYSEAHHLPYSSVKSRVQRARKRLRRALETRCELEFDARGRPTACSPKQAKCCAKP